MRSKTYLELAVLPYRDDINNSNIEQWGIANLPNSWFGDLTGIKKAFNPSRHLSEWSIDATSLELQPSSTKFDSFKQDLQQQLFFFYHCIEFAENNPSILVDTVIKHGIEMSDGYDNILDVMLNDIVIENAADRVIFYDFIRQTGLCYE